MSKAAKKKPAKKGKKVGGYRPRGKSKYREQAFISALVEHTGGPAVVAAALKVKPEVVINWRLRGKIPLDWVKPAAKFFRASAALLNPTVALATEHTDKKFSWEKEVSSLAFLSNDIRKSICALPTQVKAA